MKVEYNYRIITVYCGGLFGDVRIRATAEKGKFRSWKYMSVYLLNYYCDLRQSLSHFPLHLLFTLASTICQALVLKKEAGWMDGWMGMQV
jgi:hypothetical protein